MEEFKSLNKYLKKDREKVRVFSKCSYFKGLMSRVLVSLILFLIFIIGIKSHSGFSNFIYESVYRDTFLFSSFKTWYNEKFGFILPKDTFYDTTPVFSETLSYSSFSLFKDGVLLSVDDNYLVPTLNGGVVVFIGDKSDYGNCVIVQQDDGINVWYCNINNSSFSMYDYINSGDFVGEVNGNELYLVFEKNGDFLDYKEYI